MTLYCPLVQQHALVTLTHSKVKRQLSIPLSGRSGLRQARHMGNGWFELSWVTHPDAHFD